MEQAELDEQLLDTNTPVNVELPTIPDVRKYPNAHTHTHTHTQTK